MAEHRRLIEITVLERLSDGGWLFAFTAKDSDDFHAAVAILKQVPYGMRRWEPAERCWWLSGLGMMQLRKLLPEVRDALDALAQEAAREAASAAGGRGASGVPSDVVGAFTTLYLLPSAPLPVIKAAYRALASLHHPDHGGAHDLMLRINSAYTVACQWAARGAKGQKAGKAG